jgi:hypothetical protein
MIRFLLFALLLPFAACVKPDLREECGHAAEMGECDEVSHLLLALCVQCEPRNSKLTTSPFAFYTTFAIHCSNILPVEPKLAVGELCHFL